MKARSSVGQSTRLITGGSSVQARAGLFFEKKMYQVIVAHKVFFSEDYDWSLPKTLAAAREWAKNNAPDEEIKVSLISCL